MKALLLKDLYQTARYCRSYLFIITVFTLVPLFSPDTSFFSVYICLIIGMLPITLMAYDERSKWNEYSGALPYGKEQMVFSKYLIGVLGQTAAIIFSLLLNIAVKGVEGVLAVLPLFIFGFAGSCVTAGLTLPFIFALGVEKGRIAYYILMVSVFAVTFAVTNVFSGDEDTAVMGNVTPVVFLGAIVFYVVSCLISAAIYKKREVK